MRVGLLALLLLAFTKSSALGADVYVIAHRDVAEASLDETEIRNIYFGKKAHWDNNSTVFPGRYLRGDLHDEFVRGVLGRSATAFRIYWKKLIFTGQVVPFTDLDSEEKMLEWVKETEGAIGYVSTKPTAPDVKVLYHIAGDPTKSPGGEESE